MNVKNSSEKSRLLGQGLPASERAELIESLFVFGKQNQKSFLMRMSVLFVISTIIASAGLLSNSSAVVIGAMLVAPMMRPVMSSAAAITLSWTTRFFQSLTLILFMAVAAILISAFFGFISPDMVDIPKEILARTRPTFFDLAIALAAGCGGAYTMTRKEPSAIPGVAMAVALLPPLASAGILLTYFQYELAMKAVVLFTTNFLAMIFAGAITFRAVGIHPPNLSGVRSYLRLGFILVFGGLLFTLSFPLYFYSQEVWYDASYKAHQSKELQSWLKENDALVLDVSLDLENQILNLTIRSPKPPLNLKKLYDEIYIQRKHRTGKIDPFTINLLWTQGAHYTWPLEKIDDSQDRQLQTNYLPILTKHKWGWTGTQYADGHWLHPKSNKEFTLSMTKTMKVNLNLNCAFIQGEFTLNQEIVSIKVNPDNNCQKEKVAARFMSDIVEVSNIYINDNQLVFQLKNNNGMMHFHAIPIKDKRNQP